MCACLPVCLSACLRGAQILTCSPPPLLPYTLPVESLINRTLEPVEDVEESEVLSLLKEVSGAKSEGKYLLLLMFLFRGGGMCWRHILIY